MGSAALLALARRGIPCTGIDRFVPPHDRGSSHGLSRLIRLCYYEHPNYVPLLREAYGLWQWLEAEARQPLLKITGGLYIGPPTDPFIAGSLASARAHTLEHELLDAPAVRRRFPQFTLADDELGFFEPTTGVLFPERAIAANLDLAARMGARICTGERVLDWSAPAAGSASSSRGITLRTDRATHHANKLILSAGPWMPDLVPDLRPRLSVTRQVLAWFKPSDPAALTAPAMPAWAIGESGPAAPDAYYGFPIFPGARESSGPGGPGFKAALHKLGDPADPDHVDRAIRPAEIESLAAFLRKRIPAAVPRGSHTPEALLDARVCLYTSTADQHFLLDLHPAHQSVVLISACSGHGFKFAPVIALAAADLATRGETELPIGFLRWR